ncbi:glycosyltransferase family 2 protein [Ferrimicrobium sp.]|uniref:glycosyltransferase n=1 Tax=Ferrimicrobium sp. TaxID=2926050 RepID=UPI0026018FC2|nr:glycosyltransferase family 2 protein [Ferrimicrobium sp.]
MVKIQLVRSDSCVPWLIGFDLVLSIAVLWPLLVVVGEVYFAWKLLIPPRFDRSLLESASVVRVEVVIPAHNEATSLSKLLASLSAQRGVIFSVTVIDDRSIDGTGAIARSLGAEVVRLDQRRGNNPKAGALSAWSPKESTETVVFLDADVVLVGADALARLVAAARNRPNDLISVQPYHRMERWYEQFAFFPNLVALIASGAFGALGHPYSSATFGPVLCCQVARYQSVGGHGAVLDSVLDDQALGEKFRHTSGHTILYGGRSWIEFRMYPDGFWQLLEGFRKNVAIGAISVRGIGALVATLMIVAQLSAIANLVTDAPHELVGALAVVGLMFFINVLVARRIGSFTWSSMVLQVLYLAAFLVIVVMSGVDLLRGTTTWKGQPMRTRR